MKILITGGAGFIGSAVVRHILRHTADAVVNVDKLTYAGNLESLAEVAADPRYAFEQVDICNRAALDRVFREHRPDAVMHLAAESHVDRSIDGPAAFIETNIVGTYTLLEAARAYWSALEEGARARFRFHHISTDEVYGDLEGPDELFTETTPYAPSSPYSASKASSDHLVRAWRRTYGLPILITNCSNNYGPYHFPEKLIPLMILNALEGKPLPVYGKGNQVRDWLYVEDHARALYKVLTEGEIGETYNIGGHNEKQNIEVVHTICDLLDELRPMDAALPADDVGTPPCRSAALCAITAPAPATTPVNRPEGRAPTEPAPINARPIDARPTDARPVDAASPRSSYRTLITHVADRPGHDLRYAIDASKIQRELGWAPQETFESGIRKTVQWYLNNLDWCRRVQDGSYQRERLGVAA